MENIPTGYFIFIYAIIALPYLIAILGVISLVAVAILYFTNHRKAALKIFKILGITILVFIVFTLLTKSSLGI